MSNLSSRVGRVASRGFYCIDFSVAVQNFKVNLMTSGSFPQRGTHVIVCVLRNGIVHVLKTIYLWHIFQLGPIPLPVLSHDRCQNQWRKGVWELCDLPTPNDPHCHGSLDKSKNP